MAETSASRPPLFVDLDGTLIRADTLVLSLRQLAGKRPDVCLLLPFLLLRGRAVLKARVARFVFLDPKDLPYREDVLAFLREEKSRGRTLVLATAAHIRVAQAVADHLGLFDGVIATDDSHNLKGASKLAAILRDAPSGVFDYVGDSEADLPIFRRARESILVRPSSRLLARARETCTVGRIFD